MDYRVTHTTTYRYSDAVGLCHNEARLAPRACPWQSIQQHELSVEPQPSILGYREDYYGNEVVWFSFNEGYSELTVTAESRVQLEPRRLPDDSLPWHDIRDQLRSPESTSIPASEFIHPSNRVIWDAEIVEYARETFDKNVPLVEQLRRLLKRVDTDFEFDPTATTVNTPVHEVFRKRRGVCQDFAHLTLAIVRSQGLGARYVSGYIRTIPAPGKPRLAGADASHAWLSVFDGKGNWIDIDPTNNTFVGLDHITLAWGRDYADVCPLKGVLVGGGTHTLDVSVDVCPE